jgi:hypothetical protein
VEWKSEEQSQPPLHHLSPLLLSHSHFSQHKNSCYTVQALVQLTMSDLFLGSASRRQTINLGGASTRQDDLVQRARREREQREQLRMQERSVGKIQVCFPFHFLPSATSAPLLAFPHRTTCASPSSRLPLSSLPRLSTEVVAPPQRPAPLSASNSTPSSPLLLPLLPMMSFSQAGYWRFCL